MKDAVWDLFIVRCPASISTSGSDTDVGRKHHFSFEASEDLPAADWGEVVHDREPFCGRGLLKNPVWIYLHSDTLNPLNLNMYRQVRFTYFFLIINKHWCQPDQ